MFKYVDIYILHIYTNQKCVVMRMSAVLSHSQLGVHVYLSSVDTLRLRNTITPSPLPTLTTKAVSCLHAIRCRCGRNVPKVALRMPPSGPSFSNPLSTSSSF